MSNRASAVIVADSVSECGVRLTTFQLRYWRPIHSELMTHRVFSRNAGSSRARPSKKIIDQVRDEPWAPIHWGANEPGMQANSELSAADAIRGKTLWAHAAQEAARYAELLTTLGAHKQIVNRLLEPFTYIDVVVTATGYNNWFTLRDHPDAQPEIRELAQLMRKAYDASIPDKLHVGQWHLPYITDDDWEAAENYIAANRLVNKGWITQDPITYAEKLDIVRKISVARCARVSYKAFDGTVAPIAKDLELFEQLLVSQPLHASPAEHQATPDSKDEHGNWRNNALHGNLRGFVQFRKTLPHEFVPG